MTEISEDLVARKMVLDLLLVYVEIMETRLKSVKAQGIIRVSKEEALVMAIASDKEYTVLSFRLAQG